MTLELRNWTKAEAEAWFEANPQCKAMVERMRRAGVLEKTESLIYGPLDIDCITIARIAGYKTGQSP